MKCTIKKEELELNVSFPIYVIGLISFLSWFLFIVFGGIGIAAIPMDLIRAFIGRPKKNFTKEEIEVMRYKLVQDSLKVKEELENFKQNNSDGTATKSCKINKIYIQI
jgi:LMBR1 domain-containing protein 1